MPSCLVSDPGSSTGIGSTDRSSPSAGCFVTCHDGFTLNDLVSYERKHNEANREGNRDGANDNRSWNWGIEGPTEDPAIERLRNRQVKNFLALTILSVGMPMILMGDEVRRTQRGNNNGYCHDDETTWFDWTLVEKHADVRRFVTMLNQRWPMQVERRGPSTLTELLRRANRTWHGVKLHQPDWGDDSHTLAVTAEVQRARLRLHLILNAFWEPLDFELPPLGPWRRRIDLPRLAARHRRLAGGPGRSWRLIPRGGPIGGAPVCEHVLRRPRSA
jgi:isoamylase